jgi:hypothetical protein
VRGFSTAVVKIEAVNCMGPYQSRQPVTWSTGTRLGMLALRGYLLIGAVLLVVKAIQLGRG